MSDLRSDAAKLSGKRDTHAASAQILAARLEQGQAQRPVSDRAEALVAGAASEVLAVTLAIVGGAAPEQVIRTVEAFFEPTDCRVTALTDPATTVSDPVELAATLSRSGLLVVVGPGGWQPIDGELAPIRLLARHTALVWPLVLTDALPSNGGWWLDPTLRGSAGSLSPRALGDAASARRASPELLKALRLVSTTRELETLSRLLGDQHRIARMQSQARLAGAQRRATSLDDAVRRVREARSELDPVRDAFQARVSALSAEVQEANRKALLPGGALRARIADGVSAVGRADLRLEPAATTIRVTLQDGFAGRVERESRGWVRESLRDDLMRIRDGLAEIERETAAALDRAAGQPAHLVLPPPDGRELGSALEAQVEVESRFRSELPKRGFLQRVMEGRRAAFMVLILLSLFGGSLSLRKAAFFPVAMGVLFVGGTAWTYVSWKRQEDDRIGKELDRLREGLEGELRKMHAEIQREKLARLANHLSDVQKSASREIDRVARQLAQQRLDQIEAERSDVRSRIRSLEARARSRAGEAGEVEGLIAESGRVRVEAARLATAALTALREGPA